MEYNPITGSQYTVKPENMPYTTIKHNVNSHTNTDTHKHSFRPILHKNTRCPEQRKKNKRAFYPTLEVNIFYVTYNVTQHVYVSKLERKYKNKKQTMKRDSQRFKKQFLQNLPYQGFAKHEYGSANDADMLLKSIGALNNEVTR